MVRVGAFIVGACIACAACDDAVTPPPDLAAPADLAAPVDDLAVARDFAHGPPDMVACSYPPDAFGPAPDAAGFCDGTPLAGTCAQAFFARARACFHPAGCCQTTGSNTVRRTWESGATYYEALAVSEWRLTQDQFICAASSDSTTPNAYRWTASDGSELPYFDPATGELHCPDGTQLNVGTDGQCADLAALLRLPPCQVTANCCVPYPL